MPRPKKPEPPWKVVTVNELIIETKTTLDFSPHQLHQMLADCELAGEDFRLINRDERFEVPHAEIVKFFTANPRPKGRMTVKEENEALKRRLAEAEEKLRVAKAGEEVKPPKEEVYDDLGANIEKVSAAGPVVGLADASSVEPVAPLELGDTLKKEVEKRRAPQQKKKAPAGRRRRTTPANKK